MAVAPSIQSMDDRLNRRNFEALSRYIYDYSGIKMPETKITMLEGRLRRRLRATGIGSLDDYCEFLFKKDGMASESTYLIDAVTTNKTDFFREPKHFDFIQQTGLRDIVKAGHKRLRIWSSACSTGAEPYTIAMVMDEFCEKQRGLDYSILCTDICTEVLDQAIAGRTYCYRCTGCLGSCRLRAMARAGWALLQSSKWFPRCSLPWRRSVWTSPLPPRRASPP